MSTAPKNKNDNVLVASIPASADGARVPVSGDWLALALATYPMVSTRKRGFVLQLGECRVRLTARKGAWYAQLIPSPRRGAACTHVLRNTVTPQGPVVECLDCGQAWR